jgi:hypothetical protein
MRRSVAPHRLKSVMLVSRSVLVNINDPVTSPKSLETSTTKHDIPISKPCPTSPCSVPRSARYLLVCKRSTVGDGHDSRQSCLTPALDVDVPYIRAADGRILVVTLICFFRISCRDGVEQKVVVVYLYSLLSHLTGRQSSLKDPIRRKQGQKASNRQCSHLKNSSSCPALANQTQNTPGYGQFCRVLGVRSKVARGCRSDDMVLSIAKFDS